MKTTLYDFCIQNKRFDLLEDWNAEKNFPLMPKNVPPFSGKKVWWQDRFGHEWEAAIGSRSKGSGCPICAGRGRHKPTEQNNLASLCPEIASEWNYERNSPLTPDQVFANARKVVWWRCKKGHEWQASPNVRVQNRNSCPFCSNNKVLPGYNDLATTHPDIAAQWDQAKNGSLTPQQVTAGSNRRVWWRCSLGHEWKAQILLRTFQNLGCPYCSNHKILAGYNDLATLAPVIAAQWNPTLNGELTPQNVSAGSTRTVWWQCERGHSWKAIIANRTRRGDSCPYCSNKRVLKGYNDLATVEPEIATQWHPVLNGSLTPQDVVAGCNRSVWWICPEGHVWKTYINLRTSKGHRTGCPVCSGGVSQKQLDRYARLMQEAYLQLGSKKKEQIE